MKISVALCGMILVMPITIRAADEPRLLNKVTALPVALDPAFQVRAVDDLYRAGGNRVPGAVIKVLSFLHRSVTRSRREYIGATRD